MAAPPGSMAPPAGAPGFYPPRPPMPGFAPGMAPPPMMMGYPGGMMASAGSIAPQEAEDYVSAAVQHLGTDDNPAAMDIPKALDAMWEQETQRIRDLDMPTEQADFKTMSDLPIARIKRIMKSDEDVRMISAEAPVLFAKACELFVLDITTRCWANSAEERATRKRVLTREAVLATVQRTDVYDFLVGILLPGLKPQYVLEAEGDKSGAGLLVPPAIVGPMMVDSRPMMMHGGYGPPPPHHHMMHPGMMHPGHHPPPPGAFPMPMPMGPPGGPGGMAMMGPGGVPMHWQPGPYPGIGAAAPFAGGPPPPGMMPRPMAMPPGGATAAAGGGAAAASGGASASSGSSGAAAGSGATAGAPSAASAAGGGGGGIMMPYPHPRSFPPGMAGPMAGAAAGGVPHVIMQGPHGPHMMPLPAWQGPGGVPPGAAAVAGGGASGAPPRGVPAGAAAPARPAAGKAGGAMPGMHTGAGGSA